MTWPADLREQIERDMREAARLRGALTADAIAPAPLGARIEDVKSARRRVVAGRRT